MQEEGERMDNIIHPPNEGDMKWRGKQETHETQCRKTQQCKSQTMDASWGVLVPPIVSWGVRHCLGLPQEVETVFEAAFVTGIHPSFSLSLSLSPHTLLIVHPVALEMGSGGAW